MTHLKKTIYFIISGIFFVFAALQWNDPDPLIWIVCYGTMAVMYIFLALKNNLSQYLAWIMSIACSINMVILLPEISNWISEGSPSIVQSMKATIPTIEYTREFLGLFLCLISSVYDIWVFKKL